MLTEQDIQKYHDLIDGRANNRKLHKTRRKGHIKYRDTFVFMEDILREILANPYYGTTELSMACRVTSLDLNKYMHYLQEKGLLQDRRLVTTKGIKFLKLMDNLKTICPEKILYGWEYIGESEREKKLKG